MISNCLKKCIMAENRNSSGCRIQTAYSWRGPVYAGNLKFSAVCLFLIFLFLMPCPVLSGDTGHKPARGDRHSEESMASTQPAQPVKILRIHLSGSINPGMLQFLRRAVKKAETDRAELLLVILNTPGGLVKTLRDMVQTIMTSRVPVAVYVAPAGAQAASAGALFTMSAQIAAMAPGTNIGAAHPVVPGADIKKESTMNRKMENDVAALARSIATERGRNVKWAEEAVRKSVSATASEALKLKIIDFIAKNEQELLSMIDGMEVATVSGRVRLSTAHYSITEIEPVLKERLMLTIADPNIAYILMMIGAAGLYFELAHPGVILPGVAGAISMILGLFAMQVLPVNTTGLLLLALALVLFLLELFITSHGVLGIAGVISLVLGSMMLYDTPGSGVTLSASVMWPTVVFTGGFFLTIAFLAAKAQMRRPQAGREALVGEEGTVREATGPSGGMVFVHGELWKAVSPEHLEPGAEIVITGVNGMKLQVRRSAPAKGRE